MKHPFFKYVGPLLWITLLLCGSLNPGAWAMENLNAVGPLGSGDGRIQVIPALSAPSVKNGGKLTIQAVIKTVAGVAKVEAEIEGVTRLELKPANAHCGTGILPVIPGAPASVNVPNHGQDAHATMRERPRQDGPATPTGTVSLYQTEWTAQGLEEKVYPVTLRVTDLTGHVYEDHSLAFSDPAAGNSTVGSPTYPDQSAPRRVGSMRLDAWEYELSCAVMDPVGGYAYFGTRTSPALVIKVRLADLTRVGSLLLNAGENDLECAVIDPAGGFAYFGAYLGYYVPGKVVKVRLADLTRVGALTLNPGENYLKSAVIDPAHGYAYFAAYDFSTNPGKVVKVRLADFTRVGALALNPGESLVVGAAIDPVGGHAYFATWDQPGKIIKVRLSDFTRVGGLTLNAGERELTYAAIAPAGDYAYIVTQYPTERIIQIRLSDLTRAGTLALNSGERFQNAVMDPVGGYAYYSTSTDPGNVLKIRLSDFSRAGLLPVTPGTSFGSPYELTITDSTNGYVYFPYSGSDTFKSPGRVDKVRLSDFALVTTMTLNTGEDHIQCGAIDPIGTYAYYAIADTSGDIVRVRLADLTHAGRLKLKSDEKSILSAAIDPAGKYAYFGTSNSTSNSSTGGKVVRVRLSDFTLTGTLTLNDDEGCLTCAVIDPAGEYAYFGTATWPGKVVKVRLADFTRVGVLRLDPGENTLMVALIDSAGEYAYFGTNTWPGKVVKVRLSDFTRVGAVIFNAIENAVHSGVIDSAGGYAYFGIWTWPGKVVKIRLADFTEVGALTLNAGENELRSAVIDPAGDYACFGTNTSPMIVKVRLSDFTRVGALTLAAEEYNISCAIINPAGGYACYGTDTTPGRVIKVAPSAFNHALRANRVTLGERGAVKELRFYSHAAKGKLRLAIYDDGTLKKLLWQSGAVANSVAGGWVTVPVATGTPSAMSLPPGKYWLAWQTDSTASVPSYTPGIAGEGLNVNWPFGAFPASLGAGAITTNSEQWSEYLTYDIPRNGVVQWRMYP